MPAAREKIFPGIEPDLVARLKSKDRSEASAAVEEVCARFYSPLYSYLRRRGLEHHDAQDALHDLLAKMLRTEALATVDEQKGSLGSLMLVSMNRYLINWWQGRKPRGKEVNIEATEAGFGPDSQNLKDRLRDTETPARLCERKCAQDLLDHVLQRLERAYAARGMGAVFQILKPVLMHGGSLRGEDTPGMARQLHMTVGALRTHLSRLLQTYREMLEEEMRREIESPAEAKDALAQFRGLFVRR